MAWCERSLGKMFRDRTLGYPMPQWTLDITFLGILHHRSYGLANVHVQTVT